MWARIWVALKIESNQAPLSPLLSPVSRFSPLKTPLTLWRLTKWSILIMNFTCPPRGSTPPLIHHYFSYLHPCFSHLHCVLNYVCWFLTLVPASFILLSSRDVVWIAALVFSGRPSCCCRIFMDIRTPSAVYRSGGVPLVASISWRSIPVDVTIVFLFWAEDFRYPVQIHQAVIRGCLNWEVDVWDWKDEWNWVSYGLSCEKIWRESRPRHELGLIPYWNMNERG